MAARRHLKAGLVRWAVPLLIVLMVSIAGFVAARAIVDHDRDVAASRKAELESIRARALLGRARGYVAGLAAVLGTQVIADERRFTALVLGTSPTIGLPDALWIQRVTARGRAAYERRLGMPMTVVTPSGTVRRAPRAPAYLPATFVRTTAGELPAGVDVAHWAALRPVLTDLSSTFAVTATAMGTLVDRHGFFVARRADYGGRSGFIVVFVPSGWLTLTLADDPRQVAIALQGQPLDGRRTGGPGAARSFVALDRRWRIDVARPSADGLQSALPWGAAAWAPAAALIGWLAARTISRRRHAEQEVNRIFDLSIDLLAIAGVDGRLRRVNPAFERVLGYTADELLARPFLEFVHPDDREATAAAIGRLAEGESVLQFENRYVRADGGVRWLEWSTRPVLPEGLLYAVARDVTERREQQELLRQARTQLEHSRDELRTVADEQAALRRVATLVAHGVAPRHVFDTVTVETTRVLHADAATLMRFEADDTMTVVAQDAPTDTLLRIGDRVPLDGDSAALRVRATARPARMEFFNGVPGTLADLRRRSGLIGAAGAPIIAEGELWGVMLTSWADPATMPAAIEGRLAQFTELIATAIANAESRGEVTRLADEQAALRRVATLVAKEASLGEVFAAVAEEVAGVLGHVDSALFRDEGDGTASAVAIWGASAAAGIDVGMRLALDGDSVTARVLREGRPCRVLDYSAATGSIAEQARDVGIRSSVGYPVVVRGRTWGVMAVARHEAEPFPPETEARIAQFSELVATAIANSEARAEVERLADEQAALRRVATLVAEGAPAAAVFDAVAVEMRRVLGADRVALSRYEPDDEFTILAFAGVDPGIAEPGSRHSGTGDSVTARVRASGRPERIEDFRGARGIVATYVRESDLRVAVGTPIVVEGRLWGVIQASWRREEAPPADTERRMAQFAELLDTAIANADTRDQLTASRARLLTTADDARRRVVRDLHDGAQQRLVQNVLTLRLAQEALREDEGEGPSLVAEALEQAEQGIAELRELAHGILPPVLTRRGLGAAVGAVVVRLGIPVEVDIPGERFPAEIEASAYFIVAEALTNVVKHARAGGAAVRVAVGDGTLRVEVRDDGIGGADPDGHGLVGIGDRATALGGRLDVESPAGGGTVLRATLPLRF